MSDAELSRRITAASNGLAFPAGQQPSAPLCDLLAKLLVREVDARLGCSNSGVQAALTVTVTISLTLTLTLTLTRTLTRTRTLILIL